METLMLVLILTTSVWVATFCVVYACVVGKLRHENATLKRENAELRFQLARAHRLLDK
jgi:IS1 family transposase